MIFVTVGGQLPFDRLIRIIDAWVAETGRDDVFCQIGDAEFEPEHAAFARFLSPEDFSAKLDAADVLISHAGMGTIISTLQLGKPMIVFPRQAELGEHRNDHQIATAEAFKHLGDIPIAMNDDELRETLVSIDQLRAAPRIGAAASEPLINAIREFIEA